MLGEEGTARAAISPVSKALGQTAVVSSLDGFHKVHSTGGGGGCLRISVFGECLNMDVGKRGQDRRKASSKPPQTAY